jgi:hypothetical protein
MEENKGMAITAEFLRNPHRINIVVAQHHTRGIKPQQPLGIDLTLP